MVAEALSRGRPQTTETQCEEILYSVDLVPFAEEGYVNLYARDITEQARAQAALQEARDGLEVRVQERTRELEAANRALEALSQSERRQRLAAEGLLQATLALSSSLDLDGVLDRILAQTELALYLRAVAVVPATDEMAHIARQRGLEALLGVGESLVAALSCETLYGADALGAPDMALVIAGELKDAQGRRLAGLEWVRSYAVAPLHAGGRWIGSLCGFSDQPDAFGELTAHLIEGFAAEAATAIYNAILYDAERRARTLAENLAAASVALTQTLDLEAVMNTLLDYLQRLVSYDGAAVAMVRDRNLLAGRAARGAPCLTSEDVVIDVEQNASLRTLLETRQSVVIDDTRAHPSWQSRAGVTDVACWLGVPMVAGEHVIGVCELCRSSREPFTSEDVRVAEALIGQAAVAIQNAWLFGQVRTGQDRLQALSRRLVEAQEAEQRYVARELHDEAAQVLTSMTVGLSLLDRQAEQAAAVRATANELRRGLETVLENLSRLTARLRPASLDHLGLDSALRQYVEGISHQYGITGAYEALGLGERLAPDAETALYRIVQEAVNNVVRHAHATRVDVLLERRDDKLIVLVEDNGIGFDALDAQDSHSLGLAGMRERAEMLGGTLVVESSLGAGTTVLVEVPYGDSDTHRR
jgi:signal transduction histidine kinase